MNHLGDKFGGDLRALQTRCSNARLAGVIVMLLACMLLGLSGCKYSDVLTQHIEDPVLGVLDEDAEPIYESNPEAEVRPDLVDVSTGESNDENTQVQVLPHYDPDAPDNGPTMRRVKSPDTPHDEEAAEGDDTEQEPDRAGEGAAVDDAGNSQKDPEPEEEQAETEPPEESTPEPEEPEPEEPEPEEPEPEDPAGGEEPTPEGPDSNNDTGEDEGSGEELTSDEVTEGDESTSEGAGGEDVIVDPNGTSQEVAKGTIAAVGEYATIAQMLGGTGALAACDQAWLDARSGDGAFSGELDRVQVGFLEDGSMEGSCLVDELVNSIKPSVVLWDSLANIPALTESDKALLAQAGITVQPVPHLGEQTTEDSQVTGAVQEVAAVLEGAGGLQYDPINVLGEYMSFHDSALITCYQANSGYSYKHCDDAYIYLYQNAPLAGLDSSTTTRVTTAYVDSVMQPSISNATIAQTATVVDGVIRLAHDGQSLDVSDGIGLSATSAASSYMLIDYYLQLAGVMNNAYDTALPDAQGRPYIIMPGSTADLGASSIYASRSTASALFYNSGDGTVASNWHVLGNPDFPAVLVSSGDIAQTFVNSAAKENGLYRMENPYQVIVVPTGIAGQWDEGHVDSFLLAPWAFRIANADNLASAGEYAQAFYQKFFRCQSWESAIADWSSAYTAG